MLYFKYLRQGCHVVTRVHFFVGLSAGRAGLIFTAITIQRLYCTFDDHLSQQWLPLLVALLKITLSYFYPTGINVTVECLLVECHLVKENYC